MLDIKKRAFGRRRGRNGLKISSDIDMKKRFVFVDGQVNR